MIYVNPNSVRARLALKLHALICQAQREPQIVRTAALAEGLTAEQMFAAVLTTAALEVVGMTGDEP